MNINIHLENGDDIEVRNVSKIIRHMFQAIEAKEFDEPTFKDFTIQKTNYTFVGSTSVAIHGSNILYVEFSN